MDLNHVAVVSKVGSKESEDAAKNVAKKLLAKKVKVYTVSPVEADGAKKVNDLEELKTTKLD
ncbi:MAG: NAD(+)/NADH kinase, partial [Nitrosopumilaceae archaeon]